MILYIDEGREEERREKESGWGQARGEENKKDNDFLSMFKTLPLKSLARSSHHSTLHSTPHYTTHTEEKRREELRAHSWNSVKSK